MVAIAWISIIFGLLVLGGGIMGFVKAHSMPSIIMGIVSDLLFNVAALACFRNQRWGAVLSLALAALLALFFLVRFLSSHKWMPAGIMFLLSLSVLALLIFLYLKK